MNIFARMVVSRQLQTLATFAAILCFVLAALFVETFRHGTANILFLFLFVLSVIIASFLLSNGQTVPALHMYIYDVVGSRIVLMPGWWLLWPAIEPIYQIPTTDYRPPEKIKNEKGKLVPHPLFERIKVNTKDGGPISFVFELVAPFTTKPEHAMQQIQQLTPPDTISDPPAFPEELYEIARANLVLAVARVVKAEITQKDVEQLGNKMDMINERVNEELTRMLQDPQCGLWSTMQVNLFDPKAAGIEVSKAKEEGRAAGDRFAGVIETLKAANVSPNLAAGIAAAAEALGIITTGASRDKRSRRDRDREEDEG